MGCCRQTGSKWNGTGCFGSARGVCCVETQREVGIFQALNVQARRMAPWPSGQPVQDVRTSVRDT
jgi:hypothetical protein